MKPVAYEFLHPNGHAIVDYSEHTHVGNLTADKGYTARPLMYAEHAVEALAALRTMCADPWAYRSAEGVKKLAKIAGRLAGTLGVTEDAAVRAWMGGASIEEAKALPTTCPHGTPHRWSCEQCDASGVMASHTDQPGEPK